MLLHPKSLLTNSLWKRFFAMTFSLLRCLFRQDVPILASKDASKASILTKNRFQSEFVNRL